MVRIIERGAEPAERFKPDDFLAWVKKQLALAEAVQVAEAGPFGYHLHRQLFALGVQTSLSQPVCLGAEHHPASTTTRPTRAS